MMPLCAGCLAEGPSLGCEGPAALGAISQPCAGAVGAWHSPFGEGRARSPFPGAAGGLGTTVPTVGPGRAGPSGTAAAMRGWDAARHSTGTWARLPRWLTPKTSACRAHFFQAYLSYGAAGPGGWHGGHGRLSPGSTVAAARPAAVAHLGKARAVPGAGGAPLALPAASPPLLLRSGLGAVFHLSRFSPDRSPPRRRRTRSAHFHLPLQVNKRRLARGGRQRSWPEQAGPELLPNAALAGRAPLPRGPSSPGEGPWGGIWPWKPLGMGAPGWEALAGLISNLIPVLLSSCQN